MRKRARLRAAASALALIAATFLFATEGTDSLAAGGLANPGFELGVLNGDPVSWNVTSRAHSVRVTDVETPAEHPAYSQMGGISVAPHKGDLMLRLATPRGSSQDENAGTDAVSQTFVSDSAALRTAFRVFSWEHRGLDLVRIDIKDGPASVGDLTAPLQVKKQNGAVIATCTDIPCQFSLDVGSPGQYLDSGWLTLDVVGLPADGRSLTLFYQVHQTIDDDDNEAHLGTWAYFDNVSTPPVAKFSMAPDDPEEGDAVQLLDLSYDPDPGDTIVSWLWSVNGETFEGQNPYYVFPNQGIYDVSLTVTDSTGETATVSGGQNASDGDPVPLATVTNASPLVNALNPEALSGREFELTGRLLDAGYQDGHTATWAVSGNPLAAVDEENEPLISSGLVTAPYTTSTNRDGTLTVLDGDGGSQSDDFSITVVPDTPASRSRHEPNNTTADAPTLLSDGQYLSWVQDEGDIDVYEVRLPGGAPLEAGSELLATLSNQPADLDVAILTAPPAGGSTGFSRVGFSRVGFSRVGFSRVDSSIIGFSRVGFSRVGFSRVGFSRVGMSTFNASGVGWADIGFSRVGFSRVGFSRVGAEVTPLDLNLNELGLASVGGGEIQVADFSANRGLDDETAWAVSSDSGTSFYVAVFGANGEHSQTPYTLSLEVIEPPALEFDLGAVCDGSPMVTAGQTSVPTLLYDYAGGAEPTATVILTQEQRMRATYGMDDGAWSAFMTDLAALAAHPSVRADVVSLPSTIFDDWDTHPCSIEAANSVTTQIKDVLSSPQWADARNIVLAGNDNIVPFRRVPDDTVIGNEQDYILDSLQEPGSPLFASILQGYILSDDYYADSLANDWQGGDLFIPDRAIGRLVETPDEIAGAARAFVDSGGVLNPETGFVAGYDFFQDGAQVIGDNLDSGLAGTVERLINETWTADQLRCRLLGEGTDPACGTRDVSAPNAHFTHYAALSANGFATDNFADYLGAIEVANAGDGTPILAGDVIFSMGCHAGFNAPDEGSLGPDAGSGIDPALDFAQTMARQQAIFVASTGYGLGDDQGIGGTEKLMGVFAEKLLAGGVTAGDALAAAKQQYLSELAVMTVYDVKSSIQATMYGLPMYEVLPVSTLMLAPAAAAEETIAENFELTTLDDLSDTPVVTSSHTLTPVTDTEGTYYTADGESQATAGRAIQPKLAFKPEERHTYTATPPPVHSVVVRAATYSDIDPYDPVFARPTVEWETFGGEHQECLDAFSPSENAYLNTLETDGVLTQTVVAVLAQFRCTSGDAPMATGIERLFSSMTLELLRCGSEDLTPPAINDIQIRVVDPDTNTVEVRVDVSDSGGVKRIIVLKPGAEGLESTELVLPEPFPTSGVFDIQVSGVAAGDNVMVQAEDGNCNTATDTGKGAGRNFLTVDAGPDQPVSPPFDASYTATVFGFGQMEGPVWFVSEFSDGKFVDGVLAPESLRTVPVTVDGAGNATFTVQHAFGPTPPAAFGATLEVHAADGGVGVDDLAFFCNAGSADGDCDLVFDSEEPTCDADPENTGLRPERIDGQFAGVSDDGDEAIDEPLPEGSSGFDCDGDGYTGASEDHVYSYLSQTNGDQKTCMDYDTEFPDPNQTLASPSKSWPADLVSAGFPSSFNRISLSDITSFLAPVRYINTNVGTHPADIRWDIAPGPGIFNRDININDITSLLTADTGHPPMVGGLKVFNGPSCPWPP